MRAFILIYILLLIYPTSIFSQKLVKNEDKSITVTAHTNFFHDPSGRQIEINEFQDSLSTGNYSITIKDTLNGCAKNQLKSKKINNSTLMVGQEFLDFDFTSSMSSQKKLLFITFWDITCKPCIEELISLNNMANEYQDIALYAVTSNSDVEVRSLKEERNYVWENIKIVTNYPFYAKFNIKTVPFSIILDKNRIIRKIISGKNINAIHSFFEKEKNNID